MRGVALLGASAAIVKVPNIMPERAQPTSILPRDDFMWRYVEEPLVCDEPGLARNAKWVMWQETTNWLGNSYYWRREPGDRIQYAGCLSELGPPVQPVAAEEARVIRPDSPGDRREI